MGSIIKVEHLSYVYNPGMPNAVTALDDVSFEVEEGDFVGIIGATGSGRDRGAQVVYHRCSRQAPGPYRCDRC